MLFIVSATSHLFVKSSKMLFSSHSLRYPPHWTSFNLIGLHYSVAVYGFTKMVWNSECTFSSRGPIWWLANSSLFDDAAADALWWIIILSYVNIKTGFQSNHRSLQPATKSATARDLNNIIYLVQEINFLRHFAASSLTNCCGIYWIIKFIRKIHTILSQPEWNDKKRDAVPSWLY